MTKSESYWMPQLDLARREYLTFNYDKVKDGNSDSGGVDGALRWV